ncbi:MAG: M3 family oligoendopeptidase [Planctomycetota bacterium]|jgi:oligoendopeptidase F
MSGNDYPRKFVAADDTLSKWAEIEPYFDQLAGREVRDTSELIKWLEDYSELVACIDEVGTDRHVKMTCQTDDEERKNAFLDFIENIEPPCKPRLHQLNVKYANIPLARDLPGERYAVLDRGIRAQVDIFREENVPLQTQESKLQQQFQEISGAQVVSFDGREQTMQMLSLYAEDTDRQKRQAAWEAEANRRLQDTETLEDIFDQLLSLRHRMASNAGCGDFREYAFKAKQRFDYTPEDCIAFHDAVQRAVVPVVRDIQRRRAASLGVDPLRPWDTSVDVKGRPPLRPFSDVAQLCDKASRIFHRVDAELGSQFDEMRERGYLDLESRKGKAPGGYQATYDESRHPFIFMNAVGTQRDVRTLIHEGGHAFHSYAAREDALVGYRSSPIEFAEVASFGMELLSCPFLDEFFAGEELGRAQRDQFEGIITLFPWVATIDAFQHKLYTQPDHSREQRRSWWLELRERFGGAVDYTGYEEALAYAWQRQLHLFEVPFYYIEYGIAKLGALQVWRNAMRDRAEATTRYRRALALGGSRPLPELFKTAGAAFDFSYDTLAPLMELVQGELQSLPE